MARCHAGSLAQYNSSAREGSSYPTRSEYARTQGYLCAEHAMSALETARRLLAGHRRDCVTHRILRTVPGGLVVVKLVVAAIVAATILSACSSATTAGGFPRVEGTYTGMMNISAIDFGISENFPMRLTVEQDGQQVTASGVLEFQGEQSTFVLTGTIDKTGNFTSYNQGTAPGFIDTALCGRIVQLSGSLAFSGRKAFFEMVLNSQTCGLISYGAELTR